MPIVKVLMTILQRTSPPARVAASADQEHTRPFVIHFQKSSNSPAVSPSGHVARYSILRFGKKQAHKIRRTESFGTDERLARTKTARCPHRNRGTSYTVEDVPF